MPRNPTRSLWFSITLDRSLTNFQLSLKKSRNFFHGILSSENKSKSKRPLPTARRCSPWKSCPPGLASCSWTPQQSISASTQTKDSQWNSGECLVIRWFWFTHFSEKSSFYRILLGIAILFCNIWATFLKIYGQPFTLNIWNKYWILESAHFYNVTWWELLVHWNWCELSVG